MTLALALIAALAIGALVAVTRNLIGAQERFAERLDAAYKAGADDRREMSDRLMEMVNVSHYTQTSSATLADEQQEAFERFASLELHVPAIPDDESAFDAEPHEESDAVLAALGLDD